MTLMNGRAVSGFRAVKAGELLETRLHDGSILSRVENTIKRDDQREN